MAKCDEAMAFERAISELIDELYGKGSDYREDPPIHDQAFWVDIAETRFHTYGREPAFIANYLCIVVKERRDQKAEAIGRKLH